MVEQTSGLLTAHCLDESLPDESHISGWKDLIEINDRRYRLPAVLTGRTRHLHFHNRGADPRQTCWASTFKHNWLNDIQAIFFLLLMFFGGFSQRLRISDFSLFESQQPPPTPKLPKPSGFKSCCGSVKMIKNKCMWIFAANSQAKRITH